MLESLTVCVGGSVSQAVWWCSKPMPPLWASHEDVAMLFGGGKMCFIIMLSNAIHLQTTHGPSKLQTR